MTFEILPNFFSGDYYEVYKSGYNFCPTTENSFSVLAEHIIVG
jgi:hypothetical protein